MAAVGRPLAHLHALRPPLLLLLQPPQLALLRLAELLGRGLLAVCALALFAPAGRQLCGGQDGSVAVKGNVTAAGPRGAG